MIRLSLNAQEGLNFVEKNKKIGSVTFFENNIITFNFTNTTSKPIYFKDFEPEPDLHIDFQRKIIPPGEFAFFVVKYFTNKTGPFSRTFKVYTDENPKGYELSINGTIVSFSPNNRTRNNMFKGLPLFDSLKSKDKPELNGDKAVSFFIADYDTKKPIPFGKIMVIGLANNKQYVGFSDEKGMITNMIPEGEYILNAMIDGYNQKIAKTEIDEKLNAVFLLVSKIKKDSTPPPIPAVAKTPLPLAEKKSAVHLLNSSVISKSFEPIPIKLPAPQVSIKKSFQERTLLENIAKSSILPKIQVVKITSKNISSTISIAPPFASVSKSFEPKQFQPSISPPDILPTIDVKPNIASIVPPINVPKPNASIQKSFEPKAELAIFTTSASTTKLSSTTDILKPSSTISINKPTAYIQKSFEPRAELATVPTSASSTKLSSTTEILKPSSAISINKPTAYIQKSFEPRAELATVPTSASSTKLSSTTDILKPSSTISINKPTAYIQKSFEPRAELAPIPIPASPIRLTPSAIDTKPIANVSVNKPNAILAKSFESRPNLDMVTKPVVISTIPSSNLNTDKKMNPILTTLPQASLVKMTESKQNLSTIENPSKPKQLETSNNSSSLSANTIKVPIPVANLSKLTEDKKEILAIASVDAKPLANRDIEKVQLAKVNVSTPSAAIDKLIHEVADQPEPNISINTPPKPLVDRPLMQNLAINKSSSKILNNQSKNIELATISINSPSVALDKYEVETPKITSVPLLEPLNRNLQWPPISSQSNSKIQLNTIRIQKPIASISLSDTTPIAIKQALATISYIKTELKTENQSSKVSNKIPIYRPTAYVSPSPLEESKTSMSTLATAPSFRKIRATPRNIPRIVSRPIAIEPPTAELNILMVQAPMPSFDEVFERKPPKPDTVKNTVVQFEKEPEGPKPRINKPEVKPNIKVPSETSIEKNPLLSKDYQQSDGYDLLFLIDASESMNKPYRIGLLQIVLDSVVHSLSEKDNVGIVLFNYQTEILLPLSSSSKVSEIIEKIYALEPSGGTYAHKGVITAYKMLQPICKSNSKCRVIIATDGLLARTPQEEEDLIATVIQNYEQGIKLFVMGFNISAQARLKMWELARYGGGGLYNFTASNRMTFSNFINNVKK